MGGGDLCDSYSCFDVGLFWRVGLRRPSGVEIGFLFGSVGLRWRLDGPEEKELKFLPCPLNFLD